jgi:hypothetical protein
MCLTRQSFYHQILNRENTEVDIYLGRVFVPLDISI